MTLDLHLHTDASDGSLSSMMLVDLLVAKAIDAFAITDHDTMKAIPEAQDAAERRGLLMIPGVELSVGGSLEIHLLGYGMHETEQLEKRLDDMRQARAERLSRMLGALAALDIYIDESEVPLGESVSPGRVHVARALIQKGKATSVSDAFKRYLNPGRPAYVERDKLTVKQAIQMILQSGGLPVLAHPGIIRSDFTLLPERVREMKTYGLCGIEVYHPRHTPTQMRRLDALARQEELLITGGSDYHGWPGTVMPGGGMDLWVEKEQDFAKFLKAIESRAT